MRVCYSCGRFAEQKECGARKYVLHSYGSEYSVVYHLGNHLYTLKNEITNDREYTRRWVVKYPGLSFRELKSTVMQDLMDLDDIKGSKDAADRITYKAYRSAKYHNRAESDLSEVSTQCLEAVVQVKKGSDKLDELYIFEVNDSRMNHLPDFILKSSSTILQLAVDIDCWYGN